MDVLKKKKTDLFHLLEVRHTRGGKSSYFTLRFEMATYGKKEICLVKFFWFFTKYVKYRLLTLAFLTNLSHRSIEF